MYTIYASLSLWLYIQHIYAYRYICSHTVFGPYSTDRILFLYSRIAVSLSLSCL